MLNISAGMTLYQDNVNGALSCIFIIAAIDYENI